MPIDLNLRSLKLQGEEYTLAAKTGLSMDKILCNHCAAKELCPFRKTVEKYKIPVLMVKSCKAFIPPIKINDLTGTDHPRFNTMRFGLRWSKLLRVGQKVALVDANDEVIGHKVVKEIHSGELLEMTAKHSVNNHTVINDKLDKKEADRRLHKILRNNYGNLVYKNATHMTVIYLSD